MLQANLKMPELPPRLLEGLIELTAREALSEALVGEYIAWGVLALELGIDSPAIRRLAGLYAHDSSEQARHGLDRSLAELGLNKPEGDRAIGDYIALTARRILRGELEPVLGLSRLSQLNYARVVREALLQTMCDLQAAAELRDDQLANYTWLYPDFDARPLDELIRQECELYLKLRDTAPPDLLETSWCLACGQRDKPLSQARTQNWLKTLWRMVSQHPVLKEPVCRHCGHAELMPLSHPEARQRFLREASARN